MFANSNTKLGGNTDWLIELKFETTIIVVSGQNSIVKTKSLLVELILAY